MNSRMDDASLVCNDVISNMQMLLGNYRGKKIRIASNSFLVGWVFFQIMNGCWMIFLK